MACCARKISYNISISSELDRYIAEVNKYPILTELEEHKLSTKLYETNDKVAARRLITSHLRSVVSISKGFLGYGISQEDLIQEGNIGLMKAVRRFDPRKGVRLIVFARLWIKAEIYEYILKNWKIVKIATTKTQKKIFFKLRELRNKLKQNYGSMYSKREETTAISKILNVSEKDVINMSQKMDANYIDITECYEVLYSSKNNNPENILIKRIDQENNKALLTNAISSLDDRAQTIINDRWINDNKKPKTLDTLSKDLGISIERVRQIEKKSIRHIKEYIATY